MKALESNIWKLYLIKVCRWMMLYMPFIVPFYTENGIDLAGVFIIQSVFSISSVVCELPSGYLADLFGRRKMMIIGCLLSTIGFAIYAVSYSWLGFAFAAAVNGVSSSFISGSDSALLYDSLTASKRKGEYLKFEGRVSSMGNFAEAIAALLGGLIAMISLRSTFYGQTLLALGGLMAALLLTEPPTASLNKQKRPVWQVFNTTLKANRSLQFWIWLSSLTGIATLTMAWLAQPYFELISINIGLFGIIWAILQLIVGISSWHAHKALKHLGKRNIIFIIVTGCALLYLMLGCINHWMALGILAIFYYLRGWATPLFKDFINEQTPSEVRATILSVRSLAIRLGFAGIGPIMGWVSGLYSLSVTLMLMGTIYGLSALVLILCFNIKSRKRALNK